MKKIGLNIALEFQGSFPRSKAIDFIVKHILY